MTSLLHNQWAVRVSATSGEYFGIIAIGGRISKTILYSDYTEKNITSAQSIKSQVHEVMELRIASMCLSWTTAYIKVKIIASIHSWF